MKAVLSLACACALSGQLSLAQEIAGSESLRDRSRILQKKNPVSSETSGFTTFQGLTAAADAEGVLQHGHLWTSALPSEPVRTVSLLSRYNALTGNFGYGGNVQVSHSFGEEATNGIVFDLGRNQYDRRFDSLQYLWDSPSAKFDEATKPNTARYDVRTLNTRSEHARILGQSTVGNARFFIVGSHNVIDEIDERLRLEYKLGDGETNDDSILTYRKNRKRNSLRKSPDSRIESAYGMGAEFEHKNMNFRIGSVVRAWERLRPGTFTIQFEDSEKSPLRLDYADPLRPAVIDPLDQDSLASYEFLEMRFEDKITSDADDLAYFDFDCLSMTPNYKYTLSFGSVYREKNRDNYELRENYDAFDGNYGFTTVVADDKVGAFLDNGYDLGFFPDASLAQAHFDENRARYLYNETSSRQDSLSQNYYSYERVFGNYLNLLLEAGAWSASAGVRYENTKIETFGYEVVANVDESINIFPEYGAQDYNNISPTLSVTYQNTDTSSFAFSWQREIARPDYYDLIPYQIIARSSEVVRSGNPNLRPTLLDTATLSWSKQISEKDSFRVGVSSIEIEDFIYSIEETIRKGVYEGFKFRSKFNGASAAIQGIDFAISRLFEPKVLTGKPITARIQYQYKTSQAETASEEFSQSPLPNVAKNKSRLSLEQKLGRLSWLLQIDYTDKALDQFGPNLNTFEYLDKRLTTNARFVYKIDQRWGARFDFINLGGAPSNETIGTQKRLGKTTYDSWQCRIDVSCNW